jgi:CRP/FNR family cyclic AMP-dependent transcriptional regulator
VAPGEIRHTLARSYLFEGMSQDELQPLAAVATTRRLVRGEFLWHPGDPANDLYVVMSGEAKSFLVDANGDEIVHLLHGPGMTFGEPGYFSAERARNVAVMAVTPAVVIRLDRRDLEPFMARHPETANRALQGLATMLRWYGGVVTALQARPLRERLLMRLLDMVDMSVPSGGTDEVTAPISQSTLASMTGVSRENVNRALASLMAEGVVRRDGSRYVLVEASRLRAGVARDWPVTALHDRPGQR